MFASILPGLKRNRGFAATNEYMKIIFSKADDFHDVIVKYRQEIMTEIGMDPNGPSARPLPFAVYAFAVEEEGREPIAMGEFYFYDQAFRDYSEPIYARAADLALLADFHQLIHMRSFYIKKEYQLGGVFAYFSLAIAKVAVMLGASCCTVGTNKNKEKIIQLYRNSGWKLHGYYPVEGQDHVLASMNLRLFLENPLLESALKLMEADMEMLGELRRKKKKGLKGEED